MSDPSPDKHYENALKIATEWKDWIPYPDSTPAEWDRYNLAVAFIAFGSPCEQWGSGYCVRPETSPSTTRQITIPVERFDELEYHEQELFRLEKADYRTKWLEAVDTITTLGRREEQLKAQLPACGCIETYPQLVPGRVSHGPGCAFAASATPRSECPYCTSDNEAIRSSYYDQTCEDCVKRMGQP